MTWAGEVCLLCALSRHLNGGGGHSHCSSCVTQSTHTGSPVAVCCLLPYTAHLELGKGLLGMIWEVRSSGVVTLVE